MIKNTLTTLFFSALVSLPVYAGNVEVLHWWTSGGEAKSIDVLKQMLREEGHDWNDFAIEGGGGESAMTVLATRAISGNPPSAAQIKGHDIQEWANLGLLANMNVVALQDDWDDVIPPVIANIMKYHSEYVAVPFNIHRVNWLWANKAIFDQAGLTVPNTLDEFFVVAEKLKRLGYIPLAHGGQPFQDATVFESIALAILGSDDYRKAFVDLDMQVLQSDKMVEVFRQLKRIQGYIDIHSPGRDWNVATNMVIQGKAAMQVMGDWAKGEFTAAGKIPGQDYYCVPAFGTDNMFSYNIDSFVFFDLNNDEDIQAQRALASTIMSKPFQRLFNINKGSIPVRSDMDISDFDQCAQQSLQSFKQAQSANTLVPSMAHGMSTTSYAQGAIYDVVSSFFNDPNADPESAVHRLASAIKASI